MAVVTITVNRNLQPPVFNPTTHSQTIDETQVLGETIVWVTATDPDGVSPSHVTYTLLSSFIVSQYFAINSATGKIYVKAPLIRDTSTSNRQYTMSVSAMDKGTPPFSSQQLATVTVTVRQNNATPIFVNTPYDTQISQNVAPFVTTTQTVSATDADIREPNRRSTSTRTRKANDITRAKKHSKPEERSQDYKYSAFDMAYMGPPIYHGSSEHIAGYVSYNPYGGVHAYGAPWMYTVNPI